MNSNRLGYCFLRLRRESGPNIWSQVLSIWLVLNDIFKPHKFRNLHKVKKKKEVPPPPKEPVYRLLFQTIDRWCLHLSIAKPTKIWNYDIKLYTKRNIFIFFMFNWLKFLENTFSSKINFLNTMNMIFQSRENKFNK